MLRGVKAGESCLCLELQNLTVVRRVSERGLNSEKEDEEEKEVTMFRESHFEGRKEGEKENEKKSELSQGRETYCNREAVC